MYIQAFWQIEKYTSTIDVSEERKFYRLYLTEFMGLVGVSVLRRFVVKCIATGKSSFLDLLSTYEG